MFYLLLVQDVLFGAARESTAKAIHERFRRKQKELKRDAGDRAMRDWEALDDDLKESNRQQADQIPAKLRQIGCDYSPVVGRKPVQIEFRASEVEILAEMEHKRWLEQKDRAGWRYGPENDKVKKTNPHMLPWEELPENVKDWDRDTVRGIPENMAAARFEIYRK